MTNEQILKKAIENAIKNGYPKPPEIDRWNWKYVYENGGYWEIIFSHEFAKAFFKAERRMYLVKGNTKNATIDGGESWKCHLQQMILEEEPLKYIKKFL